MENAGIDPATSRMLSKRSTIWANSPIEFCCVALCICYFPHPLHAMLFYKAYWNVPDMNCIWVFNQKNKQIADEVAEWLRRWTANPLCFARVGSNPILVGPLSVLLQQLHLNNKTGCIHVALKRSFKFQPDKLSLKYI